MGRTLFRVVLFEVGEEVKHVLMDTGEKRAGEVRDRFYISSVRYDSVIEIRYQMVLMDRQSDHLLSLIY